MISYKKNVDIDLDAFIELYKKSTLGERRPVDNPEVMAQMKNNSSLIISAWDECRLVGISRTLTDFGYVAYLADLAVDKEYQRKGIGKQLIRETKANIDKGCMLVLLAAPAASDYYPHIGFTHNPRAWILPADCDVC